MAVKEFTEFGFTPSGGLNDAAYSPAEPESEAAIRSQIQGISDQLRDHINAVKEKLASKAAGDSGAHYIGAAEIDNLEGESVAEQLSALKALIDGVALGDIPADSLTSEKLSAGAVTEEKIASGAVSGAKLAPGAVSAAKIAAGAVTNEKLGAINGLGKRTVLRESCQWSPPKDGLYRIMLYGGGGGGGAGFQLYSTSWSSRYVLMAGGGGAYSIPVYMDIYLYAAYSYTFVIGAGGAGKTTKNYVLNNSSPTFSSTDASPTAGGESSFMIGTKTMLETSQRINGTSYKMVSASQPSGSAQTSLPQTQRIYGGAPGADAGGANAMDSILVSAGTDVAAKEGSFGGGSGGAASTAAAGAGTALPGGTPETYGCGGGGGGMPYSGIFNSSTAAAVPINSGGNGCDGAAIIEWCS